MEAVSERLPGFYTPRGRLLRSLSFHEAFGKDVVVRITSPGHADPETVAF